MAFVTPCVLMMLTLASCTSDSRDGDGPDGSELTISLESLDEVCRMSDDFQGTARVHWTVEGGRAPYEVLVNGKLLGGESGVVEVQCVGLRWVDFRSWKRAPGYRPLTVVGAVTDAAGVRASNLLLISRIEATAPALQTKTFEGGVDALTLELFAPSVCSAQTWGLYSRIPFAGTGADDVTLEVEWRVRGGRPPYTVYLAGQAIEGDSGRVRVQCRHFEDGILDSGWISVMGFALDSAGAVGSGIVETYAVARGASRAGAEESRLNGGRTYRVEGILMTIPDGLTISLDDVGYWHVDCGADACMDATCANSTYRNVCEDFFRIATLRGGVEVTFGYGTGQMHGRGRVQPWWEADSGIEADSIEEVRALMDAWAESTGKPPDLSTARWLNPAPLRLAAYADPLVCDPSFDAHPRDDIGFVRVIVAGGRWVPTGIEIDGEVVALARGRGGVQVEVDCNRHPGMRELLVNVHDIGPEAPGSILETTVDMYFLPPRHTDTGLRLGIDRYHYLDRPPFDRTVYCEPGGTVRIPWELTNGRLEKPIQVWIGGELAASRADPSQLSVDYGEHLLECPNELGLHTVLIEATDSSSPPNAARYEYLIRVVASHPSVVDW